MTGTIDAAGSETAAADSVLKAKHRAMWAMGDYPAVATDLISELGPRLVEASGVRRGDRVPERGSARGRTRRPYGGQPGGEIGRASCRERV